MPKWSQPFIIDTDAGDIGIGAVLSQVDQEGTEHAIAYSSHVLSKAECNYCVTRYCHIPTTLPTVPSQPTIYHPYKPWCPYLATRV